MLGLSHFTLYIESNFLFNRKLYQKNVEREMSALLYCMSWAVNSDEWRVNREHRPRPHNLQPPATIGGYELGWAELGCTELPGCSKTLSAYEGRQHDKAHSTYFSSSEMQNIVNHFPKFDLWKFGLDLILYHNIIQ